MRVSFLIPGFGEGGAQKQCALLLNALQAYPDIELQLVHFYGGVNFRHLEISRLAVDEIQATSFFDPRNIFRCFRTINAFHADIIFSWLHSSDVYAFFLRRLMPKACWVMAERDSSYPNAFRYQLRNIVGLGADHIIANSRQGRQYWVGRGYKAEQTSVIPNIVSPLPTELTILPRKEVVVTYAGRLEPQKNIRTLCSAFIALARKMPDVRFQIIGSGSLFEDTQTSISQAGLQNAIRLLHFQENIHTFFAKTSVFVNISFHEGMPNTLLENIQHGNVIVASRIPEHVDILGEEYPYFVDNLEDASSIAEMISFAMQAERGSQFLAHGQTVVSAMTPTAIANSYREVFEGVLK